MRQAVLILGLGLLPCAWLGARGADPPERQIPAALESAAARFAGATAWRADAELTLASPRIQVIYRGQMRSAGDRLQADFKAELFGNEVQLSILSDRTGASRLRWSNAGRVRLESRSAGEGGGPLGLPAFPGPLSGSPKALDVLREHLTFAPARADGEAPGLTIFAGSPVAERGAGAPESARIALSDSDGLPRWIESRYAGERTARLALTSYDFEVAIDSGSLTLAGGGEAEALELRSGGGDDADYLTQTLRMLRNPYPADRASLGQGRMVYLRTCQECHGVDGRAMDNFEFEAADLTAPETWTRGSSDGEAFVSIWAGTSANMPPYKDLVTEDRIWHLLNYVRSLGG